MKTHNVTNRLQEGEFIAVSDRPGGPIELSVGVYRSPEPETWFASEYVWDDNMLLSLCDGKGCWDAREAVDQQSAVNFVLAAFIALLGGLVLVALKK